MNLSCFMLQALGLQKARVFILDKKFKPSQVLYLLVGAWLSSAPYVILTSKYLIENAKRKYKHSSLFCRITNGC